MVRDSAGADTLLSAGGREAFQSGYGVELAELAGGYNGWMDVGVGLDAE